MTHDILGDLEASKRPRGPVCDVMRLREEHPDLAAQFDLALTAARFSDAAIADWIVSHGGHIIKATVLRHRRGECVRCRTS